MSDMVAAVGTAQLSKVDDLINSRRSVAARYNKALSAIDGIETHQPLEGNDHVYQLYTVLFDNESIRSRVIEALGDQEISCKVYWDPPVHTTGVYTSDKDESLPQTDHISSRVLSLPMYPSLPLADVDRVAKVISNAISDTEN